MQKYFYLIFALLLSMPLLVKGADFSLIINEIAWIGTINSANDEWIELYNNSQNPINLEGWKIITSDGTPEIKLSGTIPANGFYLLERTDDNTVPNIPADQIYKGGLGNSGEDLKLYDNSGILVDEVNCSSGWFAGNNKTKQTIERINSLASGNDAQNWQSSQNPGGTPKTKNSTGASLNNQEIPEDSPPLVQQLEIKKNYPSGIVFNEILPSPEGPDEKKEWIEIFNQNNFGVDLSEWKIKDTNGKITTYIFPKDKKISPNGFLVLSRPETKIVLNNNSDGLNFINPNGDIVDSVNYEKAPIGQSYNKTSSGWDWSSNLTPGAPNNIENKKEENKSIDKSISSEETASVGEKLPKTSNFLSIFLIALLVAVFSGLAIFALKKFLIKDL